jgi:glycosyltransferase involved in cell wall biosynthesis
MKIAVLLNTNQLGGAERSLIEQLRRQGNPERFTLFYPALPSADDRLRTFLQSSLGTSGATYPYPRGLYELSRTGRGPGVALVRALLGLPRWAFALRQRFAGHDGFYVNGNKAALVPLLLRLLGDRRPVYWHFRDFPAPGLFRAVRRLFWRTPDACADFFLVANSQAVKRSLARYFDEARITTLYNLPGELPRRTVTRVRRLGVVAMIAPWKGLHEVLLTLALFRSELRELGIEEVVLYGASLYLTDGEHRSYEAQLRRSISELRLDFVRLESGLGPREIFSEIDLLIHSAVRPEPFGRVIVEAMKSGVPVVSTALGGAAELVVPGETGLTYLPHHPAELFAQIHRYATDDALREAITQRAAAFADDLESEVGRTLQSFFD